VPYLVDTGVLVDYLRMSAGTAEYLESLGLWSYSIVTEMELIAGARDGREISTVGHLLFPYRKAHLVKEIGELGRNLMKSYAKSHGLDPADALIAATAIHEGLTLATRNRKHFSAIAGLEVEVPEYC